MCRQFGQRVAVHWQVVDGQRLQPTSRWSALKARSAPCRPAFDGDNDIVMLGHHHARRSPPGRHAQAVRLANGRAKLEASGGVTEATLRTIAETGMEYLSIGTLTKDVKAVDLSMRLSG